MYVYLYVSSIVAIYATYALVYLGILSTVPKYIYYWNIIIHVGICLLLMYRYHPFREKYRLYFYDANLIFASALLLLVNTIPINLEKASKDTTREILTLIGS